MYWKLAIQNIRRSLRDYIIYLVTLTLTAALMYSFLALGFSSDVLAMAENMSMLTTGILLMSALLRWTSGLQGCSRNDRKRQRLPTLLQQQYYGPIPSEGHQHRCLYFVL